MLLIAFLLIILIVVALVPVVISMSKRNQGLTSDVTFERVEYMDGSKLENFYDSPIDNPS